MDNKLSELSKPVGYYRFSEDGVSYYLSSPTEKLDEEVVPLYSQEYVSALQHESAVNWEAATSLVAESEELKRALEASKKSNVFLKEQLAQLANFNPDWDMLEACRESWREVAAALKEAEARLAVKDIGFTPPDTCRAAMLAQPVSSGYKLVPAEATEDMIAAAMNCDDVSFNADETFCVNFGNIYAAMLAAAPEGGNGHDTRR
ncbi:hypothetical protein V6X42_01520 [Serratia marcescens]|uniref:hypothetical protein n=1 Tax=Serratia marcescens TaxID=615 RepID=UPI002FE5C9B6